MGCNNGARLHLNLRRDARDLVNEMLDTKPTKMTSKVLIRTETQQEFHLLEKITGSEAGKAWFVHGKDTCVQIHAPGMPVMGFDEAAPLMDYLIFPFKEYAALLNIEIPEKKEVVEFVNGEVTVQCEFDFKNEWIDIRAVNVNYPSGISFSIIKKLYEKIIFERRV
jgi:hypothetical protein